MKVTIGGRLAAASLSVCLSLLASAAPSYAVFQVLPGDSGGGMTCMNCHQVNSISGTATAGSATNNSEGAGSSFDIHYDVPIDGQTYSGQVMTQVVNADGSVSVQTFPISDIGSSTGQYATGYNLAQIPLGGSASISISETARARRLPSSVSSR